MNIILIFRKIIIISRMFRTTETNEQTTFQFETKHKINTRTQTDAY